MNGYEVFWQIHEMNPDVNFVFASGYFDPEEKERLAEIRHVCLYSEAIFPGGCCW